MTYLSGSGEIVNNHLVKSLTLGAVIWAAQGSGLWTER